MFNVDGTPNQGGSITHEVSLMINYQGHKEKAVFEICDLGKTKCILGYTWLWKHNPEIDWGLGEIKMTRCPSECNVAIRKMKKMKKTKKIAAHWAYQVTIEEVEDEERHVQIGGVMSEDEDAILEEINYEQEK